VRGIPVQAVTATAAPRDCRRRITRSDRQKARDRVVGGRLAQTLLDPQLNLARSKPGTVAEHVQHRSWIAPVAGRSSGRTTGMGSFPRLRRTE
jgi:hypothetical protein